jgi:fluoride exporter
VSLLEHEHLKAEYFWIALGSALGGAGRHWLSGLLAHRFGESFPVGTLAVNVSGSFLIGLVAALSDPEGRLLVHPTTRQFIMVGVLGGYTTFSSFSLQTFNLAREGEWLSAAAYTTLSFVLCLLAVWLGHALGQMWNR